MPAVGGGTSGGVVAFDGGKGDAAEGGRSPVSARAPAEGDADVNGSATVVGSSAKSAAAGV